MRATWNGEVIAESDDTVSMEGNHYFPAEAVRKEFLVPSETHTNCAWKGLASYHSLKVGDNINTDAAWYYPDPRPAAVEIKDRVAFWRGVKVEKGETRARVAEVPPGASCDVDPAGLARAWGIGGLLRRLTGR
jgi:uncharacterized protein (DUF427 family)